MIVWISPFVNLLLWILYLSSALGFCYLIRYWSDATLLGRVVIVGVGGLAPVGVWALVSTTVMPLG